jgi:hypothetical protein
MNKRSKALSPEAHLGASSFARLAKGQTCALSGRGQDSDLSTPLPNLDASGAKV